MREPINWKLIGLGIIVMVIAFLVIIFADGGNDSVYVVNPIGAILVVASFFMIAIGFRLKAGE